MNKNINERMSAGVEFIPSAAALAYRGADLEFYDFKGKTVADVTPDDAGFAAALRERGAKSCRVFSTTLSIETDSLIVDNGSIWNHEAEKFDYVFFDAGAAPKFDHIDDVSRITEWLSRWLTPGGVCFAVLKTGLVQTDWDVFNSVLLTPIGRLPSSPYLYDVLLRDFAVRPLIRLKEPDHGRYCVSRVFRLSRRRPTLMLVLGQSQSGKTTLARELRLNAPHSHLSSDYIFYNLFQHRSVQALPGCGKRLAQMLGSGSAEATGNFFRTVEQDKDILMEYLTLAQSLMPKHSNLISMDIDLREQKSIDFTKDFFSNLGYSVWMVTR